MLADHQHSSQELYGGLYKKVRFYIMMSQIKHDLHYIDFKFSLCVFRYQPPISPLVALCCFLIAERHRGDASEWSPYIDALPGSYTCPVYFPDDIIHLLPGSLLKKAMEQKERFEDLYSSSLTFFRSLQPLFSQPAEKLFTQDALRWAWCSVNTRTVYMEHDQSKYLSREKDVYALAPYLDMLNHCPNVQVRTVS